MNLNSMDYNRNLYYFSKYRGIGILCIPKNKSPFLIVPLMEYERAKKSSKIEVIIWEKGIRLFELLSGQLKKHKIKVSTLGMIQDDLPFTTYKALRRSIKRIKIKDISDYCLRLRSIKTSAEIRIIRKSAQIASEIVSDCINNFKNFKTEKDVEKFLHRKTIENGCSLAFPPIVASGKTSCMPHAEPRNIKLSKGFCVIDFGVCYKGYHTDITRTIYLGTPSNSEIGIYNFLLKVQKELESRCSDLYNKTLILLKDLAPNFNHGLGHGIGLQIHELPNIKANSKDTFKNNMTFTIEPGIYFENKFGIRIEDDILIHNDKVEILTTSSKKLVVME